MEGPTCKTEVRLQIKNAFLEIYKLMEKMISLYFGLSENGKCREISGQSSMKSAFGGFYLFLLHGCNNHRRFPHEVPRNAIGQKKFDSYSTLTHIL